MDAIIAQGFEAGGHRGQFNLSRFDEKLSTHVLTRLLAQHLSLPIIAAGGIMTGADIASIMLMGAQGVQLGSAFIGCSESGASHCHKIF
ncbi:nitronate monooxygenase [Bartonella krasnovii]|nr:nitronate monooxygenase [Bartonella krasnovii]